MKIKKRERPRIIFASDYERVKGEFKKKNFLSLRNFLRKASWVSVFLLLGQGLDFSEHVISVKNAAIMILSAVTIILYDEFGWKISLSDLYEYDLYEQKDPSER